MHGHWGSELKSSHNRNLRPAKPTRLWEKTNIEKPHETTTRQDLHAAISRNGQAFLETWEACGLPPQTLSQVVGGATWQKKIGFLSFMNCTFCGVSSSNIFHKTFWHWMADMVVWRSLQISIAWDFWCNLRGPHILSCHEAKAAVNVDVLPFSLGKICEAPIGWGLLWWSSWATPGGARATTCYRPIVVAAGGPFVWIFLGFSTIRVPTNPIWCINISHTFPIKLASFGVSRYQQVSDTPIWQYDHIAYIYICIYI